MCLHTKRCCTACADALTGCVKWRLQRQDRWLQPDAGHQCRLGEAPRVAGLAIQVYEEKRAGVWKVLRTAGTCTRKGIYAREYCSRNWQQHYPPANSQPARTADSVESEKRQTAAYQDGAGDLSPCRCRRT